MDSYMREWREAAKLTLSQAERFVGLPPLRMVRLEAGEVEATASELAALALLYDCDPSRLTDGPGPPLSRTLDLDETTATSTLLIYLEVERGIVVTDIDACCVLDAKGVEGHEELDGGYTDAELAVARKWLRPHVGALHQVMTDAAYEYIRAAEKIEVPTSEK